MQEGPESEQRPVRDRWGWGRISRFMLTIPRLVELGGAASESLSEDGESPCRPSFAHGPNYPTRREGNWHSTRRFKVFRRFRGPKTQLSTAAFASLIIGSRPKGERNPLRTLAVDQAPPSDRRSTVASGGSVRTTDRRWPCDGTGTVWTPPKLPWPLPPYSLASVFRISVHGPAHGTPTR
jgi:hypothetical protein